MPLSATVKIRCEHRVAWFVHCPWCESERRETEYRDRRERERHMTLEERIQDLKRRDSRWQ